jgi:hypothetical protein
LATMDSWQGGAKVSTSLPREGRSVNSTSAKVRPEPVVPSTFGPPGATRSLTPPTNRITECATFCARLQTSASNAGEPGNTERGLSILVDTAGRPLAVGVRGRKRATRRRSDRGPVAETQV